MKLDIIMFVNAFLNPIVIKIFLFAITIGMFFMIVRILIDRKLKTIKPIEMKSSTLMLIAIALFIIAFLLLKYLR